MQHVEISKLDAIIDEESRTPEERMLYRDIFAAACHLHATGEQVAGNKLLSTLFDCLGRNLRKTYFTELAGSIEGNEERYAMDIGAHLEINELFQK